MKRVDGGRTDYLYVLVDSLYLSEIFFQFITCPSCTEEENTQHIQNRCNRRTDDEDVVDDSLPHLIRSSAAFLLVCESTTGSAANSYQNELHFQATPRRSHEAAATARLWTDHQGAPPLQQRPLVECEKIRELAASLKHRLGE